MNYYIDTEFIEGTQKRHFLGFSIGNTKPTIDLISIGIVAEDGREYYAISKEFNLKEAWNRFDEKVNPDYKPDLEDGHYNPKFIKVYWIRENILKPMWIEKCKEGFTFFNSPLTPHGIETLFTYNNFKKIIRKYGKTKKQIAEEVQKFVATTHCNCDRNEEDVNICKRHTPISFYGYYSAYDWVAFCQLFGIMMNLPKGFPYYCRDLKQIADNIWETTGKDTRFNTGKEEHNSLLDARWNKEFHKFLLNIK